MYIHYDPNPTGNRAGDCAVRAVAKALGTDWETAYVMIAVNGYQMGDVMSSDSVWGSVLRQHGFKRKTIPDTCPDCYTVEAFCYDNPHGTFVIGTGSHAVCVQNGNIFDAWDSSKEVPAYVWYKEKK